MLFCSVAAVDSPPKTVGGLLAALCFRLAMVSVTLAALRCPPAARRLLSSALCQLETSPALDYLFFPIIIFYLLLSRQLSLGVPANSPLRSLLRPALFSFRLALRSLLNGAPRSVADSPTSPHSNQAASTAPACHQRLELAQNQTCSRTYHLNTSAYNIISCPRSPSHQLLDRAFGGARHC